jgi:hypothetical protein
VGLGFEPPRAYHSKALIFQGFFYYPEETLKSKNAVLYKKMPILFIKVVQNLYKLYAI